MFMCISIPPSIPHFGPNFGTTRTMYHFDTPLGTTPLTTSVDRLTFLAFVECITSYLTIRLGTSPRPPGHLYISCGCVVCSGVME